MNTGQDNAVPEDRQERDEAISPREAAVREVLQAITASRTDPRPVFEVTLRNATQLCGAPFANLVLLDEARSHWRLVAHHGDGLRHLSIGKTTPMDSNLVPSVAMRTAQVTHIEDLTDTDLYRQGDPGRVAMVEAEGMRTILGVPLVRDGEAIGCITLFRREVKAFSREEIALVETFAAQAVIAIENVRQFREIQTRLEREVATSEVLGVISSSRDDDQPVFDVILENAANLCNAPHAFLQLRNEADTHLEVAAQNFRTSKFLDGLRANPIPTRNNPGSISVLSMETPEPSHYEDIRDLRGTALYTEQLGYAMDDEGMRTALFVPLFSDGRGIGVIVLYRLEVAPFRPDEIALVQTFAAQAVIAIENVRQFRELQSRLERERASKEILHVISQSRDDEQPVFEAIVDHARRLCDAAMAVLVLGQEGDPCQRLAAHRGLPDHVAELYHAGEFTMDPATAIAPRAILDRKVLNLRDMAELPEYRAGDPRFVAIVEDFGARSNIVVPLILDGRGIGALFLPRREVRPYTDDEIALVEAFAAQAVIAIENARQFRALEKLNAELGDRVMQQVDELERFGRLKRFLPSQVADAVVSSGDDALLASHRALIATLFCDIRGFTAFCENAEPEDTIEVLQTYHESLGALIAGHGAGVDHRAGDGIMVIFNDPLPCDDPAGEALRLAIAMRTRMADLCAGWKRLGHQLGFGVGISLGYATVGLVGAEGRFDYTASGTAVNLAARLCEHASDGEILLSPRAALAVETVAEMESAGELTLKGFREPVGVKRAIGLRGAA